MRPVSASSSPRLGTRTSTGASEGARRSRVEDDGAAGRRDRRLDGADGHLVLQQRHGRGGEDVARRRDVAGPHVRVGARAHDDRVLPRPVDRDQRHARRRVLIDDHVLDVDALVRKALAQARALRIAPDAADHRDVRAQARDGHRLVGALAAGQLAAVAAEHGLPRHRVVLDRHHEVEVDRADDDDHSAPIAPMTRSQKRVTSSSIATRALGGCSRRPWRSTTVAPRVQRPSVSMATKVSTLRRTRRIDHQRQRAGVVHRRARHAVDRAVGVGEERQPADGGLRGRVADGAQALDDLRRGLRLMGQVEAHHGQRLAAGEDDLRRLGVDERVELCVGARVAARGGAAHPDDLLHRLRRVLEQRRDVGQRAGGDHGRRAAVDHQLHRPARVERHGGLGQLGPVQPALAVDVERRDEVAAPRPGGARRHGDVGHAGQGQHAPGVERHLLELGVAADGGHGAQVDRVGAAGGQQDGDRVVVAGVAVEQERAGVGHRGSLDRRSPRGRPKRRALSGSGPRRIADGSRRSAPRATWATRDKLSRCGRSSTTRTSASGESRTYRSPFRASRAGRLARWFSRASDPGQTGTTPLRFHGRSTTLPSAISSARQMTGRVSRGSMTSSIIPLRAAM